MTYAELVATPLVDQEEVHEFVGGRYPVPDLDPLLMSPGLEDWRQERQDYLGEIVIAKVVEFDDESRRRHCTAWLRRTGMDDETLQDYDYYQVACDCLPGAEASGEIGKIFGCNALQRAFNRRAKMVDQAFRHSETLVQKIEYDHRKEKVRLSAGGKRMLEDYTLSLLDHTLQHPEIWIANHVGGSHNLVLLAMVMGREVDEMQKTAKSLEDRGLVELEGDTNVKLTESYRRFLEQFEDNTELPLQ